VEEELLEDIRAACDPLPATRVLDHKLAYWSGGRGYTCPSYEITRLEDGVTISVPASSRLRLRRCFGGLDRPRARSSCDCGNAGMDPCEMLARPLAVRAARLGVQTALIWVLL
jgi:hypothetical protein